MFRYSVDDAVSEILVAAQLLDLGLAKPRELKPVLGCSMRSLHRARRTYLDGGAAALVPSKRGPKPSGIEEGRATAIRTMHAQGLSQRAMAARLGISQPTVQAALVRLGLPTRPKRSGVVQGELLALQAAETEVLAVETSVAPEALDASAALDDAGAEPVCTTAAVPEVKLPATSDEAVVPAVDVEDAPAAVVAASVEDPARADGATDIEEAVATPRAGSLEESSPKAPDAPMSWDSDPDNRVVDREMARLGRLEDAAPLFRDRVGVPAAGVLLAVPLLVASGVLDAAHGVYGNLGPAFYGLRNTLLTLLVMALLRIKNPESLERDAPCELGWALGLDRVPEMKTLRRKLALMAADPTTSERFLRELVERRVRAREEALGFLYVDGHVRVYSGKVDLPKAQVARMRIAPPATQDVWVNDAEGDPVFFIIQEVHPQLVGALPGVLADARKLVGPQRRITVVFDRGGWSPNLFARMAKKGFDVLTYRTGKVDPLPDDAFSLHPVPGSGGKQHYELADTTVRVGTKRIAMRQVTRRKGQHQTHIVTTRLELSAADVAWRMFARWRQEDFFEYMRQEYAIDALVQHGTEQDNPEREVPNPQLKVIGRELRAARSELHALEAEYGAAAIDNPEAKRRTMRGFKIAHGTRLGIPLRAARERVAALLARRRALPARVPIGSVKDDVLRLPRFRKRLADGLKMLAWQIETDLLRLVAPHYARSLDEGRPLVTSALRSRADIRLLPGELHVVLAPQSSPHRTRAIVQLCQLLNDTCTCFPGSNLKMRFSVSGE